MNGIEQKKLISWWESQFDDITIEYVPEHDVIVFTRGKEKISIIGDFDEFNVLKMTYPASREVGELRGADTRPFLIEPEHITLMLDREKEEFGRKNHGS